MDGKMFDGVGKFLVVCAGAIAAAGVIVGVGGTKLMSGGKEDSVVGVKLSAEQEVLRKNGALCDAYLKEAFGKALSAPKGQQVVKLELPKNPAQNCPKK